MIITSQEIRKEVNRLWPDCYVVATDTSFQTIELYLLQSEFGKIYTEVNAELGRYVEKIYECEDICKVFIGRIVEAQVKLPRNESNRFSWPVGVALVESRRGPHYEIAARVNSGWVFYEPQRDQWESNIDPIFIFM